LIVIVDHDSGRLVWAAPGRDKATLNRFFDALGKSRSAKLREVSADGAEWIADVVRSRCLNARLAMDAFHVVAWATDALVLLGSAGPSTTPRFDRSGAVLEVISWRVHHTPFPSRLCLFCRS